MLACILVAWMNGNVVWKSPEPMACHECTTKGIPGAFAAAELRGVKLEKATCDRVPLPRSRPHNS